MENARTVKSMANSKTPFNSQSGFTLAELIIVVTIILAVGALSIPNFTRAIDTSRIKGAAQSLAAVYQDARIRATQKDTSYQVLISPGTSPAQICIDLDGDGTCSAGDPITAFAGQIKVSNLGVPVPLGPAQLNYQTTNTEHFNGLTWNAMGLPCQRPPSSPTAACTAIGWVQHLQLLRANGGVMYAAVTVSPTGRVKVWTFIPSGNGNGSWL